MLDKEKKDKWGLPVLSMDGGIKDNEKKMRKDIGVGGGGDVRGGGERTFIHWDRGHPVGGWHS